MPGKTCLSQNSVSFLPTSVSVKTQRGRIAPRPLLQGKHEAIKAKWRLSNAVSSSSCDRESTERRRLLLFNQVKAVILNLCLRLHCGRVAWFQYAEIRERILHSKKTPFCRRNPSCSHASHAQAALRFRKEGGGGERERGGLPEKSNDPNYDHFNKHMKLGGFRLDPGILYSFN